MRIKRIIKQTCEIIETEQSDYFGKYRRCVNGSWFNRLGDSWVEVGITAHLEEEYERFKAEERREERNKVPGEAEGHESG